jgi:hypothetical protein
MNHHDNDDLLRLQLRGLRREIEPGADLWPGIAARLGNQAAPAQRRARSRWAPLAMAASLVLAAGLAWKMPGMAPPSPSAEPLVQREAAALARQYEGAFEELARLPSGASAEPYATALQQLDQSAAQILGAIELDPNSPLLLDQLRRTYARRLAITQRATLTT